MTAQRKCNVIHAAGTAALAATLALNFDAAMLVAGLALGWLLWLFGVSLSLHKWNCHNAWQPRNGIIELALLYVGTLACLESHIAWAGGHKVHHSKSDRGDDPFSPAGKSWWGIIKLGLYYHDDPPIRINLRCWRDKPAHRWFHRHYFKVLGVTGLLIFAVAPSQAGYLIALPVCYVLTGYCWITVVAHHHNDPHDHPVAAILFPGEGYHAAHHANPCHPAPGKIDLTAPIIAMLG